SVMGDEERASDGRVAEIDPLLSDEIAAPRHRREGLRAVRADDEVAPRLERAAGRALVEEPVRGPGLEDGHRRVARKDLPFDREEPVRRLRTDLRAQRALADERRDAGRGSRVEVAGREGEIRNPAELAGGSRRRAVGDPVVAVDVIETRESGALLVVPPGADLGVDPEAVLPFVDLARDRGERLANRRAWSHEGGRRACRPRSRWG